MEHEKAGLIPTAAWKKKRYGKAWQEGETLSVAIGQSFNLVTPHIIKQFEPEVVDRLKGQGRNLQLVRKGLVEAVNGRHGTGRRARLKDLGITVAGKTGTAQVVRLKQYKHLKDKDIPYKYRDHAWFTCFAPAENPEIAVTVLVEHGLHGGSSAAPVARAVLETYFRERLAGGEEISIQILEGGTPLLTRTAGDKDLPNESGVKKNVAF